MKIIREIETQPREAYCGSIGWIAPDGAMEFNVVIRTLMYRADRFDPNERGRRRGL
jgi:para-aminobenzoate synthetase component 1